MKDETKPLLWRLVGSIIFTPFYVLLTGFVLMRLWQWFAVPLLGLPDLGLFQLLGLSLIAQWAIPSGLKREDGGDAEEPSQRHARVYIKPVVTDLFILGFGAIFNAIIT